MTIYTTPSQNQNLRVTNIYGARAVTCGWHVNETFKHVYGAVVAGGTSELCDRCRQDQARAELPGLVRVALADPSLSHTRFRDGSIYIYGRDVTSPSGVRLMLGCPEPMYNAIVEEMRARGAAGRCGALSPLSPTEGLYSSR